MPFLKSHPFSRPSCLFSTAAAAAAASSTELLPWIPPPKRQRSGLETATSSASPVAAAASSSVGRAQTKDVTDDPKQLFALFSQAARHPGFRHDHPSYRALISRLTRLEGLKAVYRILFHMRNEKLPSRPAILVALIDVCAACGFPIKPLSILLSSTPAINEKVFVKLVDVLIQTGRLETARSIFSNEDVVSKLGFPLRVRHYVDVVRACCDRGETPAAVELLDEMAQRGLVPDVFCYGSVVARICHGGGSVDDALAVVDQMRRAGREPDVVVYNTLVHGCVRKGELERAEAIVREMEEGEVGCDAGTYNTLIGGMMGRRRGNSGDGVKVLRTMMERGIAPDVITFTALFSWLCGEGMAPETSAALGVMAKMGIRPTGHCRRVLLGGGGGMVAANG